MSDDPMYGLGRIAAPDARDHRYPLRAHIRLLGVNTPERNETGWLAASEFTREWLADAGAGWSLLAETVKTDAFGRYLATVWRVNDGRCLNDDLLAAGHATPYTKGRI